MVVKTAGIRTNGYNGHNRQNPLMDESLQGNDYVRTAGIRNYGQIPNADAVSPEQIHPY